MSGIFMLLQAAELQSRLPPEPAAFRFLDLPSEIRDMIYKTIFANVSMKPELRRRGLSDDISKTKLKLDLSTAASILFTCRQVYGESIPAFWNLAFLDISDVYWHSEHAELFQRPSFNPKECLQRLEFHIPNCILPTLGDDPCNLQHLSDLPRIASLRTIKVITNFLPPETNEWADSVEPTAKCFERVLRENAVSELLIDATFSAWGFRPIDVDEFWSALTARIFEKLVTTDKVELEASVDEGYQGFCRITRPRPPQAPDAQKTRKKSRPLHRRRR